VITLGRCSHRQNIVVTDETLREKAISVFAAGRGGDVTYHGPGQLTVYPVFDLNRYRRDIHFFLRQLEGVVICSLERLGVRSERLPGLTGVWVDGKKISSIGIAVRSWISFHGLTVNVKNDDLDNFRLIRPCGLDVEMTSLESCLGKTVEINSVKQGFIESFRGAFAG
jgi:lipoate-protein ligase B